MKYTVTFSCGHTGVVELFGKSADREKKLEWYQDTAVCPDCYKKSWDMQRLEERQQAYENAKKMNLPALTGSDKQIAWAVTIRDRFFSLLNAYIDSHAKNTKTEAGKTFFRELKLRAQAFFSAQTKAVYWIDNRWELTERPLAFSEQINKIISSMENYSDQKEITAFRCSRALQEKADEAEGIFIPGTAEDAFS